MNRTAAALSEVHLSLRTRIPVSDRPVPHPVGPLPVVRGRRRVGIRASRVARSRRRVDRVRRRRAVRRRAGHYPITPRPARSPRRRSSARIGSPVRRPTPSPNATVARPRPPVPARPARGPVRIDPVRIDPAPGAPTAPAPPPASGGRPRARRPRDRRRAAMAVAVVRAGRAVVVPVRRRSRRGGSCAGLSTSC